MKFRLGKGAMASPDLDLVMIFEKGPTRSVQALLDAHPDGLILSDPKGTVRALNSSACALIRTTKKEACGRSLDSLIRQGERASKELIDALRSGKKLDDIWASPDGNRLLINARPIGGLEYERVGSLIVLRDLATINYQARGNTQIDSTVAFRTPHRERNKKDLPLQRSLSPLLDKVLKRGELAINRGARILLTGETGSGKTEIARTLHSLSFHESSPFIHVNCGGIPESLFESEMFGYEKGAFTGALQKGKAGHIESANNGVLFLDEVGEMPLVVQSKLLTFLEEGRIQRVGSSKTVEVNVRLISATNQSLLQMVQEGRFRKDLYYRLAVVRLEVHPLRLQPELLPHLIDHALARINSTRIPQLKLSEELYDWMLAYGYPGNIRELANLLEVLAVTADDTADIAHLAESCLGGGDEEKEQNLAGTDRTTVSSAIPEVGECGNLKEAVAAFEEKMISEAIRTHGSKRKAALALGVNVSTIVRKMSRSREKRTTDDSKA